MPSGATRGVAGSPAARPLLPGQLSPAPLDFLLYKGDETVFLAPQKARFTPAQVWPTDTTAPPVSQGWPGVLCSHGNK